MILFLSRSNSEIFLSKDAETAEAEFSDNKELNEAANWLKAASNGRLDEGVEGGDEKSRLDDMGDEEDVVLLPFELFWKFEGDEPIYLSSESRLRSKMLVKLSSETFPNMLMLFCSKYYNNNSSLVFLRRGEWGIFQ